MSVKVRILGSQQSAGESHVPGQEARLYHLQTTYSESGVILRVLPTSVHLIIPAVILGTRTIIPNSQILAKANS